MAGGKDQRRQDMTRVMGQISVRGDRVMEPILFVCLAMLAQGRRVLAACVTLAVVSALLVTVEVSQLCL